MTHCVAEVTSGTFKVISGLVGKLHCPHPEAPGSIASTLERSLHFEKSPPFTEEKFPVPWGRREDPGFPMIPEIDLFL